MDTAFLDDLEVPGETVQIKDQMGNIIFHTGHLVSKENLKNAFLQFQISYLAPEFKKIDERFVKIEARVQIIENELAWIRKALWALFIGTATGFGFMGKILIEILDRL